MNPKTDAALVDVEGRQVKLTHLRKPLYPNGYTKGEVVQYFVNIAPAILPWLRNRPATLVRYPDGTDHDGFFAKHAPAHRPDWIRTATVTSPGSGSSIEYIVIDDLPTLMWAANQAALEIHTPPWHLADPDHPDTLVLDLDPGHPATVIECARVAEATRHLLETHGLPCTVATSGSKGLHLIAPLDGATGDQTRDLAHTIARTLERAHPDLVVSRMAKDARAGKVFIDWSQAGGRKTNITAYSLRRAPAPSIATPVTWPELAAAHHPDDLHFTPDQVVDRVRRFGDLLHAR